MSCTEMGTGRRRAFAPGRVNLIGDHTDYVGGLALTATLAQGTTVDVAVGGNRIELRSTAADGAASLPRTVDPGEVARVQPYWARYVAAVAAVVAPPEGIVGTVQSNLPIGSGLSSSASLELSVALALVGDTAPRAELARRCRRAEHLATGVQTGLMDQLTIACSTAGHGLLIDFALETFRPVPMPDAAAFAVVHSGVRRSLADTAYETRRRDCEAARRRLGTLRDIGDAALARLPSPLRQRARHVVTENRRVQAFAAALAAADLATAGALMTESHNSLRDDLAVSTPEVDALVEWLARHPGCHGARVTGAGFGGCVVALFAAGAPLPVGATPVQPNGAAYVTDAADHR